MTQNANAIASYALKRLEVLQDGASALYGSDAMAGIVNYVLDDDLDYKKARAPLWHIALCQLRCPLI